MAIRGFRALRKPKKGDGEVKRKFGNNKVVYDGIEFDSTHERDYYIQLCLLQKAGKIRHLRRQTPFMLIPKTTKVVPVQLKTKVRYDTKVVELPSLYHDDFTFFDVEKGVYVCCEYKSKMTAKLTDYILRRKLMVQKIYKHNSKGRSQWVFREVVYYNKKKTIITDK